MTLADDYFEAQAKLGIQEDRVIDILEAVFGAGGVHWEEFDCDFYDASIEIYCVPLGHYDLTPLWEAGFDRCWLHTGKERDAAIERHFVSGRVSEIIEAARKEREAWFDAVPTGVMCPNCVTPWKCNGPHLAPASRCHVCGAEVREGLLYCSGLSPCWRKAVGRGT